MATTIPSYRARQGLNPPATPTAKVDMSTGAALQQLGSALSDVLSQQEKRQKEKNTFAARNGYNRLQLELAQELENQQQDMAPDGSGFYEHFRTNVYQPKAADFLATVTDKDLQQQYSLLLDANDGANAADWDIKAARVERDAGYRWAETELDGMYDMMATAINADPDGYDAFLQNGMDAADEAPLPRAKKEELKAKWREMAQVAWLDRMAESQPELVLRELDADVSLMAPNTIFSMLAKAVVHQESSGNASAVSPAGAIGLMQVMPDTGAEIAKALGDKSFPHGAPSVDVVNYLSDPEVSRRYGEFYLRKQLQAFNYDVEAALIAYNGGASRAKKWLAAGRDDSVIPKESANYYREVLGRLPGYGPQGTSGVRAEFVWTRNGENKAVTLDSSEMQNVSPELARRVQQAYSSLGIKKIKINSAYRSKEHNAAVGGASKSQHLHGKAFDLNVTDLNREQRLRLIASLSAMGITGLGIGNNIIHADIGNRRAWGYDANGNAGAVPDWAKGAIAAHLANKSVAPGRAGRFADLDYDTRRKYISNAAAAVDREYRDSTKASDYEKFQMRNAVDDELSRYLQTGQGSAEFNEQAVADTLGATEYYKFVESREVNQRIFNATDGMIDMDDAEISARINEYAANPSSPLYTLRDQRVSDAVEKEGKRITALRKTSPGMAALEHEDTKAMWENLRGTGVENATPAEVQRFVSAMMEHQAAYNIDPTTREPIPREWAIKIGATLSTIPPVSANNNATAVRADIQKVYEALQTVFGDYTDEVLVQALADYHNIDETTATQIEALMGAIAYGTNPFPSADAGADPIEAETAKGERKFFGAFDYMRDAVTWALGPDKDTDEAVLQATKPADAPMAERVERAVDRLREEDTPAMRAWIVRNLGQEALDAAVSQIGD